MSLEGRTRDINIFQGLELEGSNQIALSFGVEEGGQAVAGVQKAAEKFTTLLLTEEGSVLREPERGTDFLFLMRTGQIRTDSDVTLYFKLAADDALEYAEAGQDELPEDEQLDEITLDWFALNPPKLTLGITVLTVAGTSREVILPIANVGV